MIDDVPVIDDIETTDFINRDPIVLNESNHVIDLTQPINSDTIIINKNELGALEWTEATQVLQKQSKRCLEFCKELHKVQFESTNTFSSIINFIMENTSLMDLLLDHEKS